MRGLLGEVEDGLVGHEGNVLQAGDRRDAGGRARGDDDVFRLDPGVAGFDLVAADETPGLLDHRDAETLEPFHRIMRGDRADHAVHMVMDALEIDLRFLWLYAELLAVAHDMRRMTCGDQRLGGHAAVIQAVAAHLAFFEQDRAGAHLRRTGGDGKAARSRADDADIRFYCFDHRVPR